MKMSAIRLSLLIGFICINLLIGCALQDDVTTLDSHMVSVSQRTAKLEKRISKLERKNSELDRKNSELDRRNIALKQQNRALQKTNVEVEAIIKDLQKDQDKREQRLREQFASLRVINNRVRDDLQDLIGKAELTEHKLKQTTRAYEDVDKKIENRFTRLEELIEANKNSVVRIENYLNFNASDQMSATIPPQPPGGEKLSEVELYAMAKKAFDKNDYDKARQGFQQFLQLYPQSKNADNAQFWIGETYYREKWYEKSILEYQKVLENYPQGNKLPASLLKQGLAFSNIGDKANARLILKELVKKYPKSNEAIIARKKLKGF
jgi:tol-pal system protein YbgF